MSSPLRVLASYRPRYERVPPAVNALIAGFFVLAAASATLVSLHFGPLAPGHIFPWPIVAAGILGTILLPVQLYTERHDFIVQLEEVPIILGLVFDTPGQVFTSVAIASVIVCFATKQPVQRAAFNLFKYVTEAALARVVLSVILGSASPGHLEGAVALALAVLACELLSMVSVLCVSRLSSGPLEGEYLSSMLLEGLFVWPATTALVIISVTIALQETWGAALVAVPAAVLVVCYRATNKVRDRYSNLQVLYDFTVRMAALSGTDDIIELALRDAMSVFDCMDAQLIIPAGETSIRCSLGEDDALEQEFGAMRDFEELIASGGKSIMGVRGSKEAELLGFDDLLGVRIPLSENSSGVLLVANHKVVSKTFDQEDLRLLEALSAHLSTSLTSSHLLDRLRLEVAAREHQALHDNLTGLGNRTLFHQRVITALEERHPWQQVGVMLMDLDGFKDINDTLGHHTGDSVLKEVAARLSETIGPNRFAARLGGDEFAFVIPAAASAEEVMEAATALLEAVSKPVSVEGMVLDLRASIGVSIAPQDGDDASTLLRRADVAMYSAKGSRKGVVAYDKEIDQHAKRRLLLANDLRKAFEDRQLEVWYQPVAGLPSGEIVGLEALMRWRHREHGSISPAEFIPVAEQSGLIEPLTWWVLESALEELAQWRRDGYELTMAVNISARSIQGHELVPRLRSLLDHTGVPASDLVLEVTESLMMVDPEGSERILQDLADLGVRIAIDDFGTGFSSLSRLKRMPVHTVKVDRSFVLNMHHDESDEAIVRATIELARNMGHEVIAEGVERQETWDRLAEMGCHLVQGYLLAAAMPAEAARSWLRARQSPRMATIRRLPRAKGA